MKNVRHPFTRTISAKTLLKETLDFDSAILLLTTSKGWLIVIATIPAKKAGKKVV
jgi:hypothetical protein